MHMRSLKTLFLPALCMFFLNSIFAGTNSDKPVAKVGDRVITRSEMEKALVSEYYDLESQRYESEKSWIDKRIEDVLLEKEAASKKTTKDKLEKKEIEGKISKITEKDLKDFYDQNVGKNTPEGQKPKTYGEVREKIKNYLETKARHERRERFMADLRSKYAVEINLQKPEPPKMDIAVSQIDPVVGNPEAPVTIVEFTDFQCPFCISSQQTLREILNKYPDEVKVVTRNFPLSGHEGARPLALASLCANEQGRYQEYREKAFGMQKPTDESLEKLAGEVGLDTKKFSKCLSSKKYNDQINADIEYGQSVGVRGTPAFFVNGYPIMGAAPQEDFEAMIKKALTEAH